MSMQVVLSHGPNPDIDGKRTGIRGYWQDPIDSGKKELVKVSTLAEASRVCRAYIERNHLGGGNWTGGFILDGKQQIGRVSYNGRVWDMNKREIPLE